MGWDRLRVHQRRQVYLEDALSVLVSGRLRGVCRDPKDDMVLECALTAGEQAIVSGDKDLRALSEYKGIRILSPRAYLDASLSS
jgi:predicted nucleic acid-binding protein